MRLKGGLSGQSGPTITTNLSEPREGGADVELRLFSFGSGSEEMFSETNVEEAVDRLLGLATAVGTATSPRASPIRSSLIVAESGNSPSAAPSSQSHGYDRSAASKVLSSAGRSKEGGSVYERAFDISN